MTLQPATTEALHNINTILQERRGRYLAMFPKVEKDGIWLMAKGPGRVWNVAACQDESDLLRHLGTVAEMLEEVV